MNNSVSLLSRAPLPVKISVTRRLHYFAGVMVNQPV